MEAPMCLILALDLVLSKESLMDLFYQKIKSQLKTLGAHVKQDLYFTAFSLSAASYCLSTSIIFLLHF